MFAQPYYMFTRIILVLVLVYRSLYVFMVMQIKLVVSATNYDIKNLLFFSGSQTCLLPAGYYPLEFTCICGDTLVCLQATSN